ncbi:DUF2911 domain-containing protein [Winogradskyella aurantiaca]|uniref:DUF2911 domain-containing protein n=1 Tax=Winogradskyella aurantiaca TaxID=2219558 RepID=UPI000E1CE25A|nr:DUF2911 domain-containing protein [Winogradskyella aurantiaca]
MKKLVLLVCALTFVFNVNAQLETPQPSPASKIEQKVGLTDITIEYSRPGVKGRTIFGSLEPYGKVWRTGANANTTINFSTDFVFGGTEVKAGKYALYVVPNPKTWDVMLYNETTNWGTPRNWDDAKVVAKTTVDVTNLDWVVETFSIDINNIKHDSATLDLIWEKTYVAVPFSVPTDQMVSAAIEKTMAGPSPDDYYSAAVYKLAANKDLDQAMTWIDKAVDMTSDQPRFWYLRQQSLIHAANGDKDGAIKAAKASLEGAKKAKNDGYIKMNTESLKEWGAM